MTKLQTTIRLLTIALVLGCILAGSALAADGGTAIDYSQLDNETAVFTYLTSEMGLNTAAACGVMANIEYESGFDPAIWGDGGTSHGLCQWHAGRCSALSSFCAEHGYDENSVYGQMEYLNHELSTGYTDVLNHLLSVEDNADGAYDAAWYWCYYFEVPADRENQAAQRGASASGSYYPEYVDAEIITAAADQTEVTEPARTGEIEAPEPPPAPRRPGHRHK